LNRRGFSIKQAFASLQAHATRIKRAWDIINADNAREQQRLDIEARKALKREADFHLRVISMRAAGGRVYGRGLSIARLLSITAGGAPFNLVVRLGIAGASSDEAAVSFNSNPMEVRPAVLIAAP
jgi:hypothetical protein